MSGHWDLHRQPREAPASDDGWQVIAPRNTAPRPNTGHQQAHQPARGGRDQRGARHTAGPSTRGKPKGPNRAPGHPRRHQAPAEWQHVAGAVTDTPTPRAPRLVDSDDGEESGGPQAQWRAHEPCRDQVRIRLDDELMANADTPNILARENNAFLAVVTKSDKQVTFGIWGDDTAVKAAKAAILGWVDQSATPFKANKHAKLLSTTPAKRNRLQNRWTKEIRLQRFRQNPPMNSTFGAIGTFHWPSGEFPPHEILGKSYEALDPIRMEFKCYVIYKQERSIFHVMGPGIEAVKEALLRLRRTVFQIASKQIAPVRLHMLHWSKSAQSPLSVVLEDYDHPRLLTGTATEVGPGHSPRAKDYQGDAQDDDGIRNIQKQDYVRRAILGVLDKLRYYHGNIEMRFRFGRFLATQYRATSDNTYDLEDYESMIKESQFQGLITHELGDRGMEWAAKDALHGSSKILMPLSPTTVKLSDSEPVFTAAFTFADPGGDIRLTVSWQLTQDAGSATRSHEQLSRKWARLDRDSQSTTSLLDISLTNLANSFGWSFGIEAAQSIKEKLLPTALVNFADNLKLDAEMAAKHSSDKPFVIFNAHAPGAKLVSVQQRIRYQYAVQDWDYNLELCRFQDRVYFERRNGVLAPTAVSKLYEPRWGVSVYRTEWDVMFAENEGLTVGGMTQWDASNEHVFPTGFRCTAEKESETFGELMRKLDEISEVVLAAKVGDLMDGMNVG